MSLKQTIKWLAVTLALFCVCCLFMLFGHGILSTSEGAMLTFIAIWGLSALAWPYFLIRTLIQGRRALADNRQFR
jgi:uncharacterized membrane protein YGL010W